MTNLIAFFLIHILLVNISYCMLCYIKCILFYFILFIIILFILFLLLFFYIILLHPRFGRKVSTFEEPNSLEKLRFFYCFSFKGEQVSDLNGCLEVYIMDLNLSSFTLVSFLFERKKISEK